MKFRNHDSERTGNEYEPHELIHKFLPPDILEDGLVAADMDGTMFHNDLGVLVFLEKLSDPHSWMMPPDDFKKLLLPKMHRAVLRLGLNGRVPDLPPDDCQMFFDLVDDCIELYEAFYQKKAEGGELDVHNPIVNEFALKMLEIDRLVLKMDEVFQEGTGGLLMRTRFFSGHNDLHVSELTTRMMQAKENGNRELFMNSHSSNIDYSKQRVGLDRLDSRVQDRVVREVDGVREIIMHLFEERGLPVRIVTTNLDSIAMGAIKHSSYAPLLQQNCDGKRPIIASSLALNEDAAFAPRPDKPAIFGPAKKEALLDLQGKMRRKVIIALGDSFNNDTPMGELAYENGGVFVAVGDSYQATRSKFKPFLQRMKAYFGDSDERRRYLENRLWYITKD